MYDQMHIFFLNNMLGQKKEIENLLCQYMLLDKLE